MRALALGVSRIGAENEPLEPEPVQTGGGKRGDETILSPCFQDSSWRTAFFVSAGDRVLFRLQLIVDRYRPIGELISLIGEGVDCVQLRIRDESTLRLVEYASSVVEACRSSGAIALVNGRADIALAAGAAGVQLPTHGLRPSEVKAIAPGLVIGASVHSIEEAIRAKADGADVVTFGHVFESGSHPHEAPRGLEMLRAVVEAIDLPVVAIGGIGPGNVERVREAGASAIAVIGSIWDAQESERANIVRVLRKGIET